jgi:hypothetical protein
MVNAMNEEWAPESWTLVLVTGDGAGRALARKRAGGALPLRSSVARDITRDKRILPWPGTTPRLRPCSAPPPSSAPLFSRPVTARDAGAKAALRLDLHCSAGVMSWFVHAKGALRRLLQRPRAQRIWITARSAERGALAWSRWPAVSATSGQLGSNSGLAARACGVTPPGSRRDRWTGGTPGGLRR